MLSNFVDLGFVGWKWRGEEEMGLGMRKSDVLFEDCCCLYSRFLER